MSSQTGTDVPVNVLFRDCDTSRLWVWLLARTIMRYSTRLQHVLTQPAAQIWLELYSEPSKVERDTLEVLLQSWMTLGRLGGFNSQNLQVLSQCTRPVCAMQQGPRLWAAAALLWWGWRAL